MGRRGKSAAWRRSMGITRRLHYAPPFVQLQRVCAQEVQRPRANRVRPGERRPTPTQARGQGPTPAAERWDARERPDGAPGWRARRDRPGACRARVRPGGAAREASKTWRGDSFGTGFRGYGGLARQCALGRRAQERPGPPPAPATSGRGIRNGARHRRPPRRGGGTELGREVDHGQGSWDAITLGSGPRPTCRTVRVGSVVRCPTIAAGESPAHAPTPSCRPTPSPPGPPTPPPWC